ncbi:uncharacterized protein LOC111711863 [Eurytemora carolleeae]|uniref:uncharacterized protein LOC111711863 n=1 Tax=Eurytemora carolleeae TaxID=1294199 RepID=UPI000C78002D|nr:uncharacterized protein LOC111711863 [Eurytemora carolleeae]|eukprot:XP_023342094.1 uncharacterized protein LOC111711863 [Eurytemora affinis]
MESERRDLEKDEFVWLEPPQTTQRSETLENTDDTENTENTENNENTDDVINSQGAWTGQVWSKYIQDVGIHQAKQGSEEDSEEEKEKEKGKWIGQIWTKYL